MKETTLDLADAQTRELIMPEMHRCWGGGMTLETYRKYLREVDGHPWARRQIRPFTLRDTTGKPLASLYLHAVRAYHCGRECWLGGIARVLTPPARRGRGHASELMRRILELLESEGVDGAYLFSDIDPGFYERFGFVTIGRHQVEAKISDLPTAGADAESRTLTEAVDWEAVYRIHAEMGDGEAFWLLRERDQWSYLLSRGPIRSSHCPTEAEEPLDVLLLSQGEPVGYAIACIHRDELELHEFGLRPSAEGLFDRLLACLREEGEKRGCSRFRAGWPPGRTDLLFESRFSRSDRTGGILMVADTGGGLDLDMIARGSHGSWQTDHI